MASRSIILSSPIANSQVNRMSQTEAFASFIARNLKRLLCVFILLSAHRRYSNPMRVVHMECASHACASMACALHMYKQFRFAICIDYLASSEAGGIDVEK